VAKKGGRQCKQFPLAIVVIVVVGKALKGGKIYREVGNRISTS
jgi:hypothetical protein